MVIKVYVSGISGNKEVKKRQQRVLLILDSKNVNYEVIDIAEPGAEDSKDFMQTNATSLGGTISDPSPRHPLPPQIFNDEVYCGDYDLFDMANEVDEMEKFLKLQISDTTDNLISNAAVHLKNGEVSPEEKEQSEGAVKETEAIESESKENEVPNEQTAQPEIESKDEEANEYEESKDNEAASKVKEDEVSTEDKRREDEQLEEGEETEDVEEGSESVAVAKTEHKADE
ncbi:hypothetical protein NQ317_002417 [Molorchus minor]|uniref:SH3 domain-binding glutamic acid-rich protein n=1 Tax=Molorchus minor TaxID=1323400 RepID=A0ABQ9JJW4_9CUCU|nr:hypothetical protein NQ317_002417 [Molorchus minor]